MGDASHTKHACRTGEFGKYGSLRSPLTPRAGGRSVPRPPHTGPAAGPWGSGPPRKASGSGRTAFALPVVERTVLAKKREEVKSQFQFPEALLSTETP